MIQRHYDDHGITLYTGDASTVLAGLPGRSVDCVVTSPPYWGLRDYGTARWDGGDPACTHQVRIASDNSRRPEDHRHFIAI